MRRFLWQPEGIKPIIADMGLSGAHLLSRLRQMIIAEAEAQRNELERQWSRPLSERVVKGWAIEGLKVTRYEGRNLYLSCETNESRFREGDLVLIHRGDPHNEEQALHCEILYDGETNLELSLIRGNETLLNAYPSGWVLDQDIFDASPFYLDALNLAGDTLRGREIIIPLLQGKIHPKLDYARYERACKDLETTNLNDSQIEAIAHAYATDLYHLIQGPPGSGKTLMLAHLAKLLVRDGLRVLITALTHRAIENALNKVVQVDPAIAVCKIGPQRVMEDLSVPNFEYFEQSPFAEISGGYVIGATPFAHQTRRLSEVEFDVVLFDEASQITLPLAIMGMLAGTKYIFIGDENQLPPVTVFSSEEIARCSIFSFLRGRGQDTMLEITYRLNDELTAWPSQTFYQNRLKPSETAAPRRLSLSPEETRWDFVLDPSTPAVFLDLRLTNTTVRNRTEAEVVTELTLSLLMKGIAPDEIGVVVPYRAQSRLIRSLFRQIIGEEEIVKKLVVDTVERMQGQEREVVMLSFTTSNPFFAAQVADFLLQPQRLNVAVTRPRTKLILLGSYRLLDVEQVDPAYQEAVKLLRSLLASCRTIVLPSGYLV